MTILALDLATRSGWAVVHDGNVAASGSWDLTDEIPKGKRHAPTAETRHALMVRSLRSRIEQVAQRHGVDVLAIERDFGRGAGGRLLACLQCAAQEAALEVYAAALSIPLSTWRTEIHGKPAKGAPRRDTDWFKAEAMRICAANGVPVADTDEAEAVLIGIYTSRTMRVTERLAA